MLLFHSGEGHHVFAAPRHIFRLVAIQLLFRHQLYNTCIAVEYCGGRIAAIQAQLTDAIFDQELSQALSRTLSTEGYGDTNNKGQIKAQTHAGQA